MDLLLPLGVEEVENDGFELNIVVAPEYVNEAESHSFLREIIAYAVGLGFTRFAGAVRGDSKEGIKVFFFSKPDYFDPDDMLIANFEIKAKVTTLMEQEFNL